MDFYEMKKKKRHMQTPNIGNEMSLLNSLKVKANNL